MSIPSKTYNLKPKTSVLFCGGGTLGAAMPLLAVVEELQKNYSDVSLAWVGDDSQNVKASVAKYNIPFHTVKSAKADRFLTWRWLIQPFNFLRSFIQAWKIIDKVWPDVIVNAGSFTGVPMIWAGKLLGKKIVVHQQDRLPSLSNSLTAYLANEITVAFPDQKHIFQPKIAHYIGNPVRQSLLDAYARHSRENGNPQILIIGGSSGALGLNKKFKECLPELLKKYELDPAASRGVSGRVANREVSAPPTTLQTPSSPREAAGFSEVRYKVVHLTGAGKGLDFTHENYQAVDFTVDDMPRLYAEADVVISRCGLNAISELSALKKPTVFVPLPDSHQGANAQWLADNGAQVLKQEEINSEILLQKLADAVAGQAPKWWEFYQPDAAKKLAEIVLKLVLPNKLTSLPRSELSSTTGAKNLPAGRQG